MSCRKGNIPFDRIKKDRKKLSLIEKNGKTIRLIENRNRLVWSNKKIENFCDDIARMPHTTLTE
jgi:hypothetical protein